MYVYNPGSSRKVLWACWPTSLAETANFRFNERPCFRRSGGEAIEKRHPDVNLWPPCAFIQVSVPARSRMCACTHAHTQSLVSVQPWKIVPGLWYGLRHFVGLLLSTSGSSEGKDPVTFQSSEEGSRREKWAATLISWNEALALPRVQAEVLLGLLKMFLQGRKSESILGFDKEESHCSCWDSHPRIKGPIRHHNLGYLLEMQRG